MNIVRLFLHVIHNTKLFLSRRYNFRCFLIQVFLPLLSKLNIYPKVVSLPDGLKVFVNDISTLSTNIPDQYERREYELLVDYVPGRGWVVFDIGGHVGLFSLRASKLIGKDGISFAFEPNPISYNWFLRNIELNGAQNIRLYNIALLDYQGFADFYIITEGILGASSFFLEHSLSHARKVKKISVPVTTLDKFILHQNQVKTIDLMKIDVEGAELAVLKGGIKLLKMGYINRLIIEVHIGVTSAGAVEDILKQCGYVVERKVDFGNVRNIIYARSIKIRP